MSRSNAFYRHSRIKQYLNCDARSHAMSEYVGLEGQHSGPLPGALTGTWGLLVVRHVVLISSLSVVIMLR